MAPQEWRYVSLVLMKAPSMAAHMIPRSPAGRMAAVA